ncbi:MAG TPA: hypothetical protein VEY70_08750 [Metabacillus sp.]|nr:hypothetical protein [Metabacillus sp.]
MAKVSKKEKIESIEEQIKNLMQKKKELENKMRYNVGKHLFEEWEIESEEQAISLINELKPYVKEILTKHEETVVQNEY